MPSVEQRQKAVERTQQWRVANPERAAALNRRPEYARAYYECDPERRRKQWRDSRERHREQSCRSVLRLKHDKRAFLAEVVGAACIDCGDDRPGAVEYHHPGGKEKDRVPLGHMGWEALREEAMVLLALCGACHGVRHHKEEA